MKIYKHGDTKIKKKFAILPICINHEIKWLERVTVKYRYYEHGLCQTCDGNYKSLRGWHPEEFLDK